MVRTLTFVGWMCGIAAGMYALNGPLKRRFLQRRHDEWLENLRREQAEADAAARQSEGGKA